MKIRRMLAAVGEWAAGGVFPTIAKREREIFPVDGAAYTIEVTWWRRGFSFGYHTPNLPRDVRRIRAAERTHTAEVIRRHDAGEPIVQVDDVIPAHRSYIPVVVAEVRTARGQMWRRAEGAERYARDTDGQLQLDQTYDWVTFTVDPAGVHHYAGNATDRQLLDYAPLTVTKVTEMVNR